MKKNMLIYIGTALVVLGLLALGAGLRERHIQRRIMDGPGMINEEKVKYLYYYHGGSSLGDLYRIELQGASFTVEECPGNGMKTKMKTYTVDSSFYSDLDGIIEEYGIKNWTDLPDSEIFALDAATTSLDIRFSDGSSISFSSSKELPEDGWEAVRKISGLFESRMK